MKYWAIVRSSLSRIFAFRLNFFLGRLRNIIFLLLLFYVWKGLTLKTGAFAGYTEMELLTYVFLANLLRSVIFGGRTTDLVEEINSGIFSKYLTEPVSIWWYEFSREFGHRVLNFLSAVIEVAVFAFILKVELFWQSDPLTLALFLLSVLLAVFLYQSLIFLVSALAFWSREALGPRFLFEWIMEFSSGSYFPLNILSPAWFVFLGKLPFFYILFFPISIYLGQYGFASILIGLIWQLLWIGLLYGFNSILWGLGLKRYSGEGI